MLPNLRKPMLDLRIPAAAVCLLAACTVGPDFQSPDPGVPGAFRGDDGASAASIADLPWWKVYRDQNLQALIREGLANNQDLKIAATRVEQARQLANQTRSLALPALDYSGEARRGRNQAFAPGAPSKTVDSGSVLFNMVWEIDFWGRIRRLNEAELARYFATDEARRGVIVSLVGDIAQAYFELLELDLQHEIATRSRDSFQKSFDLFQTRLEGGIASKLETSRARAAAAQAAAAIPEIERLIAQKENQLSLLTGRAPGPVRPRGALSSGADLDRAIPPGLPAAMIRRRPDIRQTEQSLRAANAEIGAAIADYYPRIGLTAGAGRFSLDLSDFTDGAGNSWSVVSNVTGPIFQGGRLKAREAQARAAWEEARLRHEKAVLVALGEVSNALVAREKFATARAGQEQAVASLREAVEVSGERYSAGRASYFEILDSQLELFPTELNLARTRLNQYLAVVALYRALGGGWSPGAISSAKEGL